MEDAVDAAHRRAQALAIGDVAGVHLDAGAFSMPAFSGDRTSATTLWPRPSAACDLSPDEPGGARDEVPRHHTQDNRLLPRAMAGEVACA